MARDYDSETLEHGRRQSAAVDKISQQKKRAAGRAPSRQQKADDQQLMNEMRSNKSVLDFNRAMHDYDVEYKREVLPI